MSKQTPEDETFFDFFTKKERMTEASDQAKEESLRAFQAGLKAATPQHEGGKPRRFKRQIIGFSSTIVVAGIVAVLALSTGMFDEQPAENELSHGNESNQEQQDVEIVTDEDEEVEEMDDLIEKIWNRQPFDYDRSNDFRGINIFNDELWISLPDGWKVDEDDGEDMYTIELTRTDEGQMNLFLFQDYTTFDKHLEEITTRFSDAEQVSIPIDTFVEEIRANAQIYFPYENVFSFDTERAEMVTYIDRTNGKLIDLYTSELFGYPMIFTSELPLNDTDSWNVPIHLFTSMRIDGSIIVHGSESELHPEFNRPMEKTVFLPIGANGIDNVNMELYINEELQISSYLPKEAEITRHEHEHFTEWRFTEPHILETTFYSFGKLKSNFPLENGKEVMFEAFDIDLSYSDTYEGVNPYHYSYDAANARSNDAEGFGIGGYIELFEANGEWYYIHKHADWNNYNGGFYFSRLQYFRDSMEWH